MKHRRHRRIPGKGVAAQLDASPDRCNIENISAGGLFLRTTSPLPLGMPVRVELTKPGQRTSLVVSGHVVSIVTEAEAARQDIAPGVGIELDRLPHDTEKRLHALLRELGLKDLADPTPLEPDDLHGSASPNTQQVASNVRGLLEMLTNALHEVKKKDEEIAKLKAEVRKLTAALADARR